MYIKNIVIRGFKSYAAEVAVTDISDGHTAVLGWNGAGKSNFFQAIQFCLCDSKFDKLRKEDRVKLLHEGMGRREHRAYVEITFDNADHRLPYATDIVTLRRQIGLDKDVFFVNHKHTSKQDVHAMLESAGFSRSNPYYILEQGKVKNLALMTDARRLDLFKEVAGTKVYEEKRADALKKLVEAKSAQMLINEEYSSLTKKLEHLEEEKSELQEYQKLDRRRRAFEFTLYQKEHQHALNKLEKIDMDRKLEAENAEQLHDSVTATATRKLEIENAINQHESRQNERKESQSQLEAKRKGLLKIVAQRQQDHDEISRHLGAARKHQSELELELRTLEEDIQRCKNELGIDGVQTSSSASSQSMSTGAVALFEAELQKYEELRVRHAECVTIVRSLQDIQGRSSQFSTQRDRDNYLNSQIKELDHSISAVNTEAVDLGKDINRLENIQLAQVQKELADEQARAKECEERISLAGEEIAKLKSERNAATESRKKLWREESTLEQDRKDAFEALTRADRALKATMPPSLASGLDAIQRLAQSIDGIRGPIIGLINVSNSAYNTAVEVVGGNALFHVVVDDETVAARCLDMLKKQKAGRVTFIPLNHVAEEIRIMKSRLPPLPPDDQDYKALTNFIECIDDDYMPAIEQIFGRTLLCRNLKVAGQMAERYNLHCVTLHGDEVSNRGVFSGGYRGRVGSGVSRLESSQKMAEARIKLFDFDEKVATMSGRLGAAEKAVTSAIQEMQSTENRRKRDRQAYARHMSGMQAIEASRRELREQLVQKQEALATLAMQSDRLMNERSALDKEMSTPLLESLAPEQQDQLRTQRELSVTLQKELQVAETRLESARAHKTELETKLHSNLERRRDEIRHELAAGLHKQNSRAKEGNDLSTLSVQPSSSFSPGTKFANKAAAELSDMLEAAEDALSTAQGELNETESQLHTLRESGSKLSKELAAKRSELEEITVLLRAQLQGLDDHSAALEKLLGKRNLNVQRRDQAIRKIRELGSVGNVGKDYANEGLDTMKKKELIENIKETVSELKQYNKVNTKALNQYINFSAQRNTLKTRKAQCIKDEESINRLIEHLDQQKDEKLMTTFRQVQKQFATVFGELVDGGIGKLVLHRKSIEGENADMSDGDDFIFDEDDDSDDESSSEDSSSEDSSSDDSSSEDGEENSIDDDGDVDATDPVKKEKNAKKARKAERGAAKEARRLARAQKLRKSVESFTGVGVKVKFSGDADTIMTKRLSGGQKDIVALALILAIQRCDPAPFYIFDELDAALDDTRRSAVAHLINRQAHALKSGGKHSRSRMQGAQFITSTFRSELVDVADAHVQVYQNSNTKASEVRKISLPDAQAFMQRIDARQNRSIKKGRRSSSQNQTSIASSMSPAASMASMSLSSVSPSDSSVKKNRHSGTSSSGEKRKRSP